MTRRSGRGDALVDRSALLAALGPCRSAVIGEMARAKAAGPLYIPARPSSPPSTLWPLC